MSFGQQQLKNITDRVAMVLELHLEKTLYLSVHASERAAQRGLSCDDIDFVVSHGIKVHNAGAVIYFLGEKRLPLDLPANDRRRKLVGSTVLVCPKCRIVITVYRNGDALRSICQKHKYNTGNSCSRCDR